MTKDRVRDNDVSTSLGPPHMPLLRSLGLKCCVVISINMALLPELDGRRPDCNRSWRPREHASYHCHPASRLV